MGKEEVIERLNGEMSYYENIADDIKKILNKLERDEFTPKEAEDRLDKFLPV